MISSEQDRGYSFFSRFKSIRSEILVSFAVLIIAAVLIFIVLAFNFTEKTVMDNAIDNTSHIIKQVNGDIDSYIDYMENTAYVVSANEDVKDYFFGENQSKVEISAEEDRILSQFQIVLDSRADIYNIAAVKKDGKALINDGKSSLNKYVALQDQDWYKKTMRAATGMYISSSHVQNAIKNSYKWVITVSRALDDPETGSRDAIFFMDLNYNAISTLCNENKIGKKGYIFVIDQEGNIIYHPQQQLLYGGLKTERIKQVRSSKESYFTVKDGNSTLLYTKSTSDKTGWTVVSVADTSELFTNDRQTRVLYIVVAAILLIIAVYISSQVALGITRPVKQLMDSMAEVEQGRFPEKEVPITTENEIGSLTKSFNVMTDQIQILMKENVKEQEKKRKSELRALQSQINPHFLYNTLDSIIWMAEGKKNEEVVIMTASLAKLLRQSISNADEVVMLDQEVSYVKSYLTIQKMRYQDKLEYEIEMEDSIRFIPIIKLVLQPIVENAIYHGLKYKEGKGSIYIKGYRDGTDVVIRIQDDGVGMTQEALAHIYEKHKVSYTSNGVGVYNVQQRLTLTYGENYGLQYESTEGVGTIVTVRIPSGEEAPDETV